MEHSEEGDDSPLSGGYCDVVEAGDVDDITVEEEESSGLPA